MERMAKIIRNMFKKPYRRRKNASRKRSVRKRTTKSN